MSTEKESVESLQQEYSMLMTKAGHLAYQRHILGKEIDSLNAAAEAINHKAAALRAAEPYLPMRFKYKDKVQVEDEFYGNPTGIVLEPLKKQMDPSKPWTWIVQLELNDGSTHQGWYNDFELKEISNESQS